MESKGNKKTRGAGEEFPAGLSGGAQPATAGVEGGLSPHSEARMRLFYCIKSYRDEDFIFLLHI